MTRVLGVVPARGGSKGIPDKNLRPLAGRPLLAYAADAARDSAVIDRLVLSTDSAAIADLGRGLGMDVPFLRPAALARDDSPMVDVIRHALAELAAAGCVPDIVVLLQPTAPLRRSGHISDAVGELRSSNCDSVVSVVEVPSHFSPDYVMKVEDGRLKPFLPGGERLTRRQDARRAYSRDGTVYAFWRRTLETSGTIYGFDCRPLVIPAGESMNLDTLDDWSAAERRMTVESR